jgi:hypothetical protein
MKKRLLFGMLAFGTMFSVQGQITATSLMFCDGDSTTLMAPPNISVLQTTLAAGNGAGGNMFDVVAVNDIIINSFDAHPQGDTDIEVYYKVGSYVGSEATAGAWTLLGTASVVAQPQGTVTAVPVPVNLTILTGQTYAFYVTSSTGSSLSYTNGSSVGSLFASDANLQFFEGIGVVYPFSTTFSPRVWNGNINYSLVSSVINWSTGQSGPSITVAPSNNTIYYVAVDNANYTDSIDIIVNPNYAINASPVNSCDSSQIGGNWYYTSQTVIDTLTTAMTGCDSVVSTALTITDITVTLNDPTLTANAIGVSYQWLDCSNGNSPIAGATSQTFTPIANGDYAVEVTDNGCTDTSACVTAATVGLDSNSLFNISVYPNPTNGEVNVNLGNLNNVTINVYTMSGQLVFNEININDSNFKFELDAVKGIYIIEVSVDEVKRQFKLVKD